MPKFYDQEEKLNQAEQKNVAVFFDFENIQLSLRNLPHEKMQLSALYKQAETYGRVVLANAYADWRVYNEWLGPLKANGFNPIHVPSFTYEGQNGKKNHKNAVDIQLSIDIADVMHNQPHIQTFVLVSGDKDFVPIVELVRRYGKRLVAIGIDETTSAHLIQAVDVFVSYSSLSGTTSEDLVFKVLRQVVQDLYDNEKNNVFPRVKDALLEKIPNFDEKDYNDKSGKPFERFKDFIMAAEELGHVQYQRDGSTHLVLPSDVSRKLPSPPIMELAEAYDLLVKAIEAVEQSGRLTRATSIKNKMLTLRPGFDEKEIKNEKDKFFHNFSHFARAAQNQGIIQVEGTGFEMVLSLPKTEAAAPEQENQLSAKLLVNPERQLIIDAIQTTTGPTPAYIFGQHCQKLCAERQIDLPNRRINQLLSEAKKIGLIKRETDSSFSVIPDPEKIEQFLKTAD